MIGLEPVYRPSFLQAQKSWRAFAIAIPSSAIAACATAAGGCWGRCSISSWIEPTFDLCFRAGERDGFTPLQQWIAPWDDLMDIEVVPALTSAGTRATIEPLL